MSDLTHVTLLACPRAPSRFHCRSALARWGTIKFDRSPGGLSQREDSQSLRDFSGPSLLLPLLALFGPPPFRLPPFLLGRSFPVLAIITVQLGKLLGQLVAQEQLAVRRLPL